MLLILIKFPVLVRPFSPQKGQNRLKNGIYFLSLNCGTMFTELPWSSIKSHPFNTVKVNSSQWLLFFSLLELGIEPRALFMVDKNLTTELST